MNINVSCPGCGRRSEVDERFAGKRVRCKRCGRAFVLSSSDRPAETVAPGPEAPSGFDGPPDEAGRAVESSPHPGRRRAALIGAGVTAGVVLVGVGALSMWLWMRRAGEQGNAGPPAGVGRVASALPPMPMPMPMPPPPGMVPPPFGVPAVPPPPPVISSDLARALGGSGSGASYPDLPPLPRERTADPGEALRESLLDQYVEIFHASLAEWDKIPGILATVQDAQDSHGAVERLRDPLRNAAERSDQLERLEPLNQTELNEYRRRIAERARAVSGRLRTALDRVSNLPNLGREMRRALLALEVGKAELDKLIKRSEPDPRRDGFVEVYISAVPDSRSSQWLAERLKSLTDAPANAGIQARYNPGARKSSYRVWPVADREAFARKITFGRARVLGKSVYVAASPIDPVERPASQSQARGQGRRDRPSHPDQGEAETSGYSPHRAD